jgi:hypothetical protein
MLKPEMLSGGFCRVIGCDEFLSKFIENNFCGVSVVVRALRSKKKDPSNFDSACRNLHEHRSSRSPSSALFRLTEINNC